MANYHITIYANGEDVDVSKTENIKFLENAINNIVRENSPSVMFGRVSYYSQEENPLFYVWMANIQDSITVNGHDVTRDLYVALCIGLKRALISKDIGLRLVTNYAAETSTTYLGKGARERDFEEVLDDLFGAVSDMIAWRDFDDEGVYDKRIDAKFDKTLRKLAKRLKIDYNKEKNKK